MESWLPVEGREGLLEVSSAGGVRSLPSVRQGMRAGKPHQQRRAGKVLSPYVAATGYLTVTPKFGASRKKLLVHRLVAKAFVPGYFDGATVNHIDGNKLNNRAANLEWVTLAENTALQWATGLINIRGERHPLSKLSNDDVLVIRERLAGGATQGELAREYGVSDTLIWNIFHRKKRSRYSGPL